MIQKSSNARLVAFFLGALGLGVLGCEGVSVVGGPPPPDSGAVDDLGTDTGTTDGPVKDGANDATPADGSADDASDTGAADASDVTTGGCRTNMDCSGSPDRPVCDTSTGLCVGCLAMPMDTCPMGQYCAVTRRCTPGCRTDEDCTGRGMNTRCDVGLHACVGCTADRDCALGTVCSEGVCTPGCSATQACPTGNTCCVSACINTQTDRMNCGSCGRACATGQDCCGGRCVTTVSDANHCGMCGMACMLSFATPRCEGGACVATDCASGHGNCDGDSSNGCETDTTTSVNHCGRCGAPCMAGSHAMATCTMGTCGIRCEDGWGDCDGMPANGCETDLTSTATACGSCTNVCTTTNGTAACMSGRCAIRGCNAGFGDCDSLVANGCETNLETTSNCGMCGRTCTSAQVCSGGACNSACASGTTLCGTACVDLTSDANNCMTCGRICPTPTNGQPTCMSGTCSFTCQPTFGNCDGNASNGCETVLTTSVNHCGMCGNACPTPANGSASCVRGSCTLGACSAGFADCDGNLANGCEVNLAQSASNCGACGNACATPANATATCASGVCGIGMCGMGFGNCDGNASNGCETALGSSNSDCGACGNVCPLGTTCTGGTCVNVCMTPTTFCNGTCADLSTSATNCGACGNACPTPANGTAACASRMCGVGMCNTGFGNCNSSAADGCETNLATSPTHCGMCGNACPAPANATATCSAGTCGFACNMGFHACGGMCVSNTSPASCGTSCMACPTPANATATCDGAACGFSCNAGFGNCDGNASNGCETDLRTAVGNCGMCGNTCPAPPNAAGSCAGGMCGLGACTTGFGNCDGNASNGCETNLATSNTNCGMCGMSCATGTMCSNGACASVCGAGTTFCSGTCVNLTNNTSNCGRCGNVCPTPANATATCASGTCGFACDPGFHNCGGMCVSNTSVATCGSSCTACPVPANATATCDGTTCGFTCNTGFHNCGGMCVSNTATATCGTSCTACPTPANATATCNGTSCGFTCNPGFHNCGGTCVSNTATATCGTSCTACPTPANATATCDGTSCGFTCNAGFHNCGGACVSNTATATCGTSCTACPTPANGTATCNGTSCGITCNMGFGNCNNNAADGCEINLTNNNANCGACGTACAVNATCNAGMCRSNAPANDLPAGAITLSTSTVGSTVTGTTVGATNQAGCSSGGDVYYRFTLTQREVVYIDTYGTGFDTTLAFATGATGNTGCNDDSCGVLQSQLVQTLAAGTYFVVVGGFGGNAGAFTLHFQHMPTGNGTFTTLTQGANRTLTGTTSGAGAVTSTCGAPTGPEHMFYYVTCPSYAGGALSATTCSRASWDTQLYFKQGNGTELCNDDSCGLQSNLTGTVTSGAALRALYIDGFGGASGAYTVLYTVP